MSRHTHVKISQIFTVLLPEHRLNNIVIMREQQYCMGQQNIVGPTMLHGPTKYCMDQQNIAWTNKILLVQQCCMDQQNIIGPTMLHGPTILHGPTKYCWSNNTHDDNVQATTL